MTRFWIDGTEEELFAMILRQPVPESFREKARALLVSHYEQESARAQYLKQGIIPLLEK